MEKEEAPSRDQRTRGDSENTSSVGQSTPFAAGRQRGDREADFRLYLDTCCGDTPGWLHIGVGYEPFINDKGRYDHKVFVPRAVRWPDEADDTIALLLAESEHADVWVCPNVMAHDWIRTKDGKRKTGRAKGQAVSRLTVHSDIDREPFDSAKAEKLAAVGGFAIASGTPGNAHVYVPLSSPVSVDEHEALCVALGDYIGGADPAKHSDNDLLRPPGTLNHKPTVFDGEPPGPCAVVVMIGIPQDPHVLAEKLGVAPKAAQTTTGAKAQTNGQASTGKRAETQPLNLNQYPMVRAALDKVTGDRSRDINRIVGACYDAGLTLAQARWCVDRRVNLVDKLDENPKRDDVLECWLKIDEDRRTRKAGASAPHDDRVITLVPASAIVSDIPDWVWEYENRGRIQRGVLTLFAGRPAAGKSTGARWFAAQFSHGNLDGCWKGKPQKIAYIGSEESREYVVKPGLQVAGANINNFVFPKVEMKGEVVSLSSDEDEHTLTKKLLEEGVTVVFVDPVMATINRKVDIYRNNELRDALAPWVRIAQRINGTVIGIVHLVKGTSADVIGSVNGSSAFGEVARCVFGFAKDPEHKTERVMSQVKNSCGPEDLSLTYEIEATLFTADTGRKGQMSMFKMGDESDITVGEILDAGRGKRRPTSPEMQRVIEFVNSRAKTDAAAVYEDGLANSQKVASNMLERASKRGLIAKKDRGVFVKSSVGATSPRTTDEKMK